MCYYLNVHFQGQRVNAWNKAFPSKVLVTQLAEQFAVIFWNKFFAKNPLLFPVMMYMKSVYTLK